MADKPEEPPGNLFQWLWRLKRYERGIYVRARINGRWQTVALAELDPQTWAMHVARWLDEGKVPTRVLEDTEVKEIVDGTAADQHQQDRGATG